MTPITATNWGKLLEDARQYIIGKELVDNEQVVIQQVPLLRKLATPCITIVPGDVTYNNGTLTGQVDVGYVVNISYIESWNQTTDTSGLGQSLAVNEKVRNMFHQTRGWATTTGQCLLYSRVESSEFMMREAAELNYAVQYFIVRCWVRENL